MEREQEIRDDVKKDWTIYLIVGVLVRKYYYRFYRKCARMLFS